MHIMKSIGSIEIPSMKAIKSGHSSNLGLRIPKLDPISPALDDIRATLILFNDGNLPLPEGHDTLIINRDSSGVEGFDGQDRFRRVTSCVINAITEMKLVNLSYDIRESDRVIYVMVRYPEKER